MAIAVVEFYFRGFKIQYTFTKSKVLQIFFDIFGNFVSPYLKLYRPLFKIPQKCNILECNYPKKTSKSNVYKIRGCIDLDF